MLYRFLLVVLLLVLAGLQYRLWVGESSRPDLWHLKQQIHEQREENQKLKERNARLEAEVADLRDGRSAIEERARSDFGMVAPGETFYQLIEPDQE